MSKIQPTHLARAAYVYIRQSTMTQVHQDVESQRRQYALVERAKQLGWDTVQVIDTDLGRSGSGQVQRDGFDDLVADVCQGQVGAVFALEASRLARNGRDWHQLLEFCSVVDSLIVDHDGIYDSSHPNDRLLLGLKGTMSEMELSTFRQRSQEAIRQKARRGEYYAHVPVGYIHLGDGRLEKHPDQRVQQALDLVFAKFREFGSARQVWLWCRQEAVTLPRRLGHVSGRLEFVPATPSMVGTILKDPTYAGIYAYGRTKRRVVLKDGHKRVVRQRRRLSDDWEVCLPAHHDGYVTWSEYVKNQETLAHNRNQLGAAVRGSARGGKGLLTGLVRCGRCGRKMQVHYSGRHTRASAAVYYKCAASQAEAIGKQLCSLFGGVTVEHAVSNAVLEALSPLRMEALIGATERVVTKRTEKRKHLALELERARYEADRCQRQYHAVEPENRLVARTLEARWNSALEHVGQLERDLAAEGSEAEPVSVDEAQRLRSLALDLPRLWNHAGASFDLKKRIVRAVVNEVVVYVGPKALRVLIHWQGGQHTELNLRKRKNGEHRWKTSDGTVALVRQLARVMPDKQIAAQLNRMGMTSAKGYTWTRTRVGNFRSNNDIPNYTPGERQARGELTIEETADRLDVSYSTVQRMIRRKQLVASQVCPGAPWMISAEHLVDAHAGAAQDRDGRQGPSSPSSNQQALDL
jgi:excisionase family DNA binding protein